MTAPPLGKYLASTGKQSNAQFNDYTHNTQEKKIRDKAVKNLSVFLSETTNVIPKSDLDKLWKGIFYGFWMSDKPLVQQALATELADLVLSISQTTSALAFLRGFWEMMVREWNGIDRLRCYTTFSSAICLLMPQTELINIICLSGDSSMPVFVS